MNSLSYLSRQFDVLAAARTLPSTPTSEFPPLAASSSAPTLDDSSIHRQTTWSLKSLVAPPSPPRRTLSSPAIIGRWTKPDPPTAVTASVPPSVTPPAASSLKPLTRRSSQRRRSSLRQKSTSQPPGLTRRMFFVRILVLVWHAVCATAHSFSVCLSLRWLWPSRAHDPSPHFKRALAAVVSEKVAVVDDEKPAITLPPDPTPPALPPHPPPVHRTPTDPPVESSVVIVHYPLSPAFVPVPAAELRVSRTPSPNLPSSVAAGSGLPTPPRRTPFHLPKTLVLDLDETLIHSTSRPLPSHGGGLLGLSFGRRERASHKVEVTLGGRSTTYHVYKRPFVDFFLRKVSAWYTLVIFTASMQEYADPVIDWLDAGTGILSRRLFRESCTQLPNGTYTKDLSVVEQDLSRVALIDNSPVSYSVNETNGIPIEGWTHDPYDEALLHLLPILDSLRFTSDVRRVLGLRGFIA
ncbi:NLI interacting factor-like phosphatase-domain-containing protein [Vararia minispora EC-137]|uniref:NLI interacting factor-like phosphatase-domain-containing protein n=1 Tax=Vararia minispora EC-137 TaxID=1314806 RepID=A0ACB8QVT0_9AGAM|nr:NLI interacting factor-like phosphatase-domain-containing protein [Vararia minispora EC-137]